MAKKKKDKLSDRGSKAKAGKLLSQYLRAIAQEETEFVKDDNGGDDRMATKAEKMARLMFEMALGFDYIEDKFDVQGTKIGSVTRHAKPDKGMISLIYDRMEGKAPPMIGDGKAGFGVTDKVTEQGKKRINKLTDDS